MNEKNISFKVNSHPNHRVSFEEWMRKIRLHVNTGDIYLKEVEF